MRSVRYSFVVRVVIAALITAFSAAAVVSQPPAPGFKSQEVSESDGIPVLIKHLPDWESVRGQATFTNNVNDLKTVLGQRPVLDLVQFTPGTEAVTAQYAAGKLLIVEYASPQLSVEADTAIKANLAGAGDTSTAYRRIGNYNVLVFDAVDPASAEALIDQVKYEKHVQWLGDNPFRISAERAFVLTTSDIFISTVLVIVIGVAISIIGGLAVGFVYFQMRERRRAAMSTFTDAGGMTRLNLDGFTPEIAPDRLLGD